MLPSLNQPFKLLGIEFAPLNTSLQRRLQTLATIHSMFWFIAIPWTVSLSAYLILYSDNYRWIPILYFCFILFDSKTPYRGSRKWQPVRNWKVWDYQAKYFPIKLVKTADLNSEKKYIVGSHPHGVFSFGAFCSFSSNHLGWDELFPGVVRRMVGLDLIFWFPLFREVLLGCGLIASSKESIGYVLDQKEGSATVILIGGAQEALSTNRETISLVLNNRKGFVKLALKHGADLVPSFSFGEHKAFKIIGNPKGSRLRRFQELVKKWLTFSPVLFVGRGIFQYTFGLLPERHPITVVVGAPIPVKKMENPTQKQIDEMHRVYVNALIDLYETHNPTYGEPGVTLDIQ